MSSAHVETLRAQVHETVTSHPVVLYMKGTPTFPQCGFSARAVSVLQACEVPFHAVNILGNDDLQEAIETYANWPTYPQLYVHGELIGGSDIMAEMHQSGELQKLLATPAP